MAGIEAAEVIERMDRMKQHIYPVEDLKPHDLEGDNCWCQPCVEEDLVIHNAMDERETYEQGRKLQ